MEVKETTPVTLGDLLDAVDGAVVTLVAGDTRLVAHRAVLAARSPALAATLCDASHSGETAVPDVEGPVLRQLLSHLYTLQAPQLPGMAPQLLAAADVYGASVLKAACEQQVAAQLTVETAAATAVLAVRHCCDRLKQAAVDFIKGRTHEVMATQGWADAVRTHPEDVVEVSRLLSEPPTEPSHVLDPAAIDQIEESTATDLGALLDAGDLAMVTLVAGDTRLAAHRAVLAARSPAFAAMLDPEALEASGCEVAVPGVEGAALRQLLSHLYTRQAPQLAGTAAQLLAAADEYSLPELRAYCQQLLSVQLAAEAEAITVPTDPGELPTEISLAASADSGTTTTATTTTTTQPHSDDSRTPAAGVLSCKCPPRNERPLSRLRIAATADGLTNQPHSNHGQTHASASSSMVVSQSHPPDDAAVSRLRSVTPEEKGKRLIEAAESGAMEELSLLLVAGAEVGARGGGQETALHRAAGRGHVDVAQRLLSAGAEVDARGGARSTPLHWAAVNGRVAVVRLLAAASADPNAGDQSGWTPLHYAASSGHAEVVTALLEAGADRAARSDAGDTPLDVARLYNQQHLTEMLR